MNNSKPHIIERVFEAILWKSRIVILLAVVFSLFGSFALFFAGSFEIYHTILYLIRASHADPDYAKLVIGVIGAVDLYLIGIVLLIFAFGIYELFISKIDIARQGDEHSLLEITSLDELKNKLLKVIIMVLIVGFFRAILSTPFQTPLEMLYFGLAILAASACTYFMHKIDKDH